MRVTCVCCSFNERDHVERSLRSLRAQRGGVIDELVLADGGSTDGTIEVGEQLADRVHVNERGGKLTDRDLAAREWCAGADVLLWADADREYPPTWAEALVAPLRHRDVVATTTGQRWDGDSLETFLSNLTYGPTVDLVTGALSGGHFLNGGSSAIRQATYVLAGGLRTAPAVDEHDHLETWLEEEVAFAERVADHGRVVRVDEAGAEPIELDTRGIRRYLPVLGWSDDDGFLDEVEDGARM